MKKDKIRIGPALPDGRHLALRRQGDEERVGIIAPIEDGKPLPDGAEILNVDNVGPDHECDGWHDAEVVYRNETASSGDSDEVPVERSSGGPAQVATPAYREGYDRIFGKKPTVGVA